jgi:ABC-type uncharacterized transport system permease subunit
MSGNGQLNFLVTSAKAHLSYPANLVGYVAVTAIGYLVRWIFLKRITELAGGSIAGWSYQKIIDLYWAGLLLALLSWALAESVDQFFRHVHLGRIEPFLTLPTSLNTIMLFRWVNTPNLIMAALLAAAVVADRSAVFCAAGLLGIAGYVTGLSLGVTGVVAMVVVLHSLTFVLHRRIPVDYVLSELFQFAQVPPATFRGWAVAALGLAVPIVTGVWAPTEALYGNFLPLALAFTVTTTLVLIAILSVRAATRRFDGLGG